MHLAYRVLFGLFCDWVSKAHMYIYVVLRGVALDLHIQHDPIENIVVIYDLFIFRLCGEGSNRLSDAIHHTDIAFVGKVGLWV